jgi:cysteine desulfurase
MAKFRTLFSLNDQGLTNEGFEKSREARYIILPPSVPNLISRVKLGFSESNSASPNLNPNFMKSNRQVYLDHAASTPVDPNVATVVDETNRKYFGNPSALNRFGQESSAAVFKARRTVAEFIGADPKEIIFTGSATEANNLALRGAVKIIKNPNIVVSSVEHESVLETAENLKDTAEIRYVPVLKSGRIDTKKLKSFLDERTVLVSIQYANSETGTIQPISKITKVIRDFRNWKFQTTNPKLQTNSNYSITQLPIYPLLHTDAVQAFQYLDCNVDKLGVDLMTLSAHKIYGPKGVGALFLRSSNNKQLMINKKNQGQVLSPLTTGGGQEFGIRSGTENISGILGFTEAIEVNEKIKTSETKRILKIKKYFAKNLEDCGAKMNNSKNSLPNILNVYFPRMRSSDLLPALDILGVSASAGSACRSRSVEPSYVLQAMGFKEERTVGSIRFSLGRGTTREEIDKALRIIKLALKKTQS